MQQVHVDSLRTTRRRRAMGDIDELAQSIKQDGLIFPVVVLSLPHRDRLLISGIRRIAAYRALGREKIPAVLVRCMSAATTAIKGQLYEVPVVPGRPGRYRMSIRDAVEFADTLATVPRDPDQEPKGYFPAREIVRALGVSSGTYAQMRSLIREADDPDLPDEIRRLAVETIDAIDDSPRQHSPLYRAWHRRRRQLAGELAAADAPISLPAVATPDLLDSPAKPAAQPTTTLPPAKQRAILSKAAGTLTGLVDGLGNLGPLHPALTVDETDEWADTLARARRHLGVVIKQLRSHNHASNAD